MQRGFATALSMLVATSCDGAGTFALTIEVRTDLEPQLEIAAVRVSVERGGRLVAEDERATLRDAEWLAGERVLETRLGAGRLEVTARALDADGGTLVERRVLLELEDDRVLSIVLSRDCRGVSCGDEQTCAAGRCVDPTCIDGDADCAPLADAGPRTDTGPSADAGPCAPAAESCDARDDDCDSRIDEGTACTADCQRAEHAGHVYLFCTAGPLFGLAFAQAEAYCSGRAYHLVKIDDMAEQTFVGATSRAIADTRWWIGLDDRDVEDELRWHDGTVPSFTFWLTGEPNDNGGNEDCAELLEASGSRWNDRECDDVHRFVCEAP